MNFVIHWLGLTDASGRPYLFWSGVGSDLTELGLVGVAYHHFNCHDQGCWRWGKHVQVDVDGHHLRTCSRHRRTTHGTR